MGTIRMMAREDDDAAYAALSERYPPPEDPFDRDHGVRIGYLDRSEPCYTRHRAQHALPRRRRRLRPRQRWMRGD